MAFLNQDLKPIRQLTPAQERFLTDAQKESLHKVQLYVEQVNRIYTVASNGNGIIDEWNLHLHINVLHPTNEEYSLYVDVFSKPVVRLANIRIPVERKW
jgi:hypothetical protein